MTETNNAATKPAQSESYLKPILTGAGIALILIAIFLSGVDRPDPAWPKLWMVKPLIIVPLAGAMGGLFFYLMQPFRYKGGWQKIVATIVSLIVYIIGLWLGSVLGLNGTLWN